MFDGMPVLFCAGSSSSASPSSSSIALSSSSSAPPSSSSIAPSSSSVPTFACTMTATTGTVGVAITPAPAVTCNGSTVTTGLAWTPANYTPTNTGSVSVSVSASSGVCSGMAVGCGSVTVSPPTLACTMTATTGTVGVAISPAPAVTCNGSTITAGLAWTPANLTPTAAGNVSVSVSASSGVCSGRAAQCGSITIYSGKGNNISSYKTVRIGDQTWMAENLNYVVEGSKCYGNDPANCDKYGSLYNWATAMALPSSYNDNSCSSQILSPHQGICPAGWHIPSDSEWTILKDYVGFSTAGTKLKAMNGWNNKDDGSSGNGTDEYGFSALPGGYGYSSGSFGSVGRYGFWWSATEYDASIAYRRYMYYSGSGVDRSYDVKSGLYSVRCLQD